MGEVVEIKKGSFTINYTSQVFSLPVAGLD